MDDALKRLNPRPIWEHFAALAAIPRPSKAEGPAADYVRSVAKSKGLPVRSDAVGNVVVEVPATKGRDGSAVLILQSHLDMVCEKNRDVVHDFLRDPIRPRVDGEWVKATGTTLGADNGIGVAAALGIITSGAIEHGPLELLFTVDEETGLTGASRLDPAILKGRTLLNLDSEDDGILYVGCAGGADTTLRLNPEWTPVPRGFTSHLLEVSGLLGGHSGGDIHLNRGNAIKILARVLWAARSSSVDLALASISGGSKHNAIPREAEAVLCLAPGAEKSLLGVLACMEEGFRSEFSGIDDGLSIRLVQHEPPDRVLSAADRERVVGLIVTLPHGVLAMSPALPGLVETSNNVAVARVDHGRVELVTSSRSSVQPSLHGVLQSVAAAGSLAGADVLVADGYPGWKPNLSSPVLGLVREVFRHRWGQEPTVTAIHAGLECGLLGERIPGLDMVSFGPRIEAPHSPDERVHVQSVQRFWDALLDVLREFSADGRSTSA